MKRDIRSKSLALWFGCALLLLAAMGVWRGGGRFAGALEPVAERNGQSPRLVPTPSSLAEVAPIAGRDRTRGQNSEPDYRFARNADGFAGCNAGQDLDFEVRRDGSISVRRAGEDWSWSLRLAGQAPDRLRGGGAMMEVDRGGGLLEWIHNGAAGIEHLLRVGRTPEEGAGLCFEFALETDLRAVPDDDGKGVGFIDAESVEVMRYDKLLVVDAVGRTLPSRMEVAMGPGMRATGISLVVDDSEAIYPVIVDPTIHSLDVAEVGFRSESSWNHAAGTAVLGGAVLFVADDGVNGGELWKSDGTEGGTAMIMDVNPGPASSVPNELVAVGAFVLFVANDGQSGRELWRTDGTEAGTILLRDITPGAAGSNPGELTALGGLCYFAASDATAGTELWKTDGTAAGTVRVKDIFPGAGLSSPSGLAAVGGVLFFAADDGSLSENELWKSDGTDGGTVMVRDIYEGGGSSDPEHIFDFNGTAYFAAETEEHGIELWRSDGTVSGTVRVKNINPLDGDSFPENFTVAGGILFFRAYDDNFDERLWKTDGTEGGTVAVKNVQPDGTMIEFGGKLYFRGDDELWKSDGSAAGTVLLKDIHQEPLTGSGAEMLGILGGRLMFAAADALAGDELWSTDGTAAGTVRVMDINPGPGGASLRGFTILGAAKAFFAADDAASGREPWTTDGTASGTLPLADINTSPSFFASLTAAGGEVYFAGRQPDTGLELWRSDGTPGGTSLVADIFPGPGSSNPTGIIERGGDIFFVARDGVHGVEMWRHRPADGTTVMIADIHPGGGSAFLGAPAFVVKSGGLHFFVANDGTNGEELWRTDGTPGGTFLLQDTWPGSRGSRAQYPLVSGSIFYYSAQNPAEGAELRRTDGTTGGTRIVKDIFPGGQGNVAHLTEMNGVIFFSAEGSGTGRELYRSDGTEPGTIPVKDIRPGSASSFPLSLTPLDGVLYFTADDGSRGTELWKSDGTNAGTDIVRDIRVPGNADVRSLIRLGSQLVFTADDGVAGREPWGSDGTSAGTLRLGDINPTGNSMTTSQLFTPAGSEVLFIANVGTSTRLWKTDGTPGGTTALFPGSGIDVLQGTLVVADDHLYVLHRPGGGSLELLGATHAPPGTLEPVGGPALGLLTTAYTASGKRLFYIAMEKGADGRAQSFLRLAGPEIEVAPPFDARLEIALDATGTNVELRFGENISDPYLLEGGSDLDDWDTLRMFSGAELNTPQLVTVPIMVTPPGRMYFRLRRTGN